MSHYVRRTTADLVAELSASYPVESVGIGAAGWMDRDCGTVLFSPHLAWRNEPLRNNLEERLGRPVTLANDADAAGWAEWRFGAGRGHVTCPDPLARGVPVAYPAFACECDGPGGQPADVDRSQDGHRRGPAGAHLQPRRLPRDHRSRGRAGSPPRPRGARTPLTASMTNWTSLGSPP